MSRGACEVLLTSAGNLLRKYVNRAYVVLDVCTQSIPLVADIRLSLGANTCEAYIGLHAKGTLKPNTSATHRLSRAVSPWKIPFGRVVMAFPTTLLFSCFAKEARGAGDERRRHVSKETALDEYRRHLNGCRVPLLSGPSWEVSPALTIVSVQFQQTETKEHLHHPPRDQSSYHYYYRSIGIPKFDSLSTRPYPSGEQCQRVISIIMRGSRIICPSPVPGWPRRATRTLPVPTPTKSVFRWNTYYNVVEKRHDQRSKPRTKFDHPQKKCRLPKNLYFYVSSTGHVKPHTMHVELHLQEVEVGKPLKNPLRQGAQVVVGEVAIFGLGVRRRARKGAEHVHVT